MMTVPSSALPRLRWFALAIAVGIAAFALLSTATPAHAASKFSAIGLCKIKKGAEQGIRAARRRECEVQEGREEDPGRQHQQRFEYERNRPWPGGASRPERPERSSGADREPRPERREWPAGRNRSHRSPMEPPARPDLPVVEQLGPPARPVLQDATGATGATGDTGATGASGTSERRHRPDRRQGPRRRHRRDRLARVRPATKGDRRQRRDRRPGPDRRPRA